MDTHTIKAVAHLARIAITEADTQAYANDLSKIIQFIEQINIINTDDIAPMSHPLNLTQRLRSDAVTATNQREQLQQCAPAIEAGLYLVPKVLDEA